MNRGTAHADERGRRGPRISDVARLAGVSVGTVSNVMNRPGIVSEATRARVRAAIDELGFVRNSAARTLVAGDADVVGLVLVDMGNSFFVDIARGVETGAQRHNMSVLIANADVELAKQAHYLSVFDEARVAGILLAPLDASLDAADRVRHHGRPVVLVNYAAHGYCGVLVNEEHGGYLAARHLIALGRTRLAFVGGPLTLRALDGRLRGVCRAVEESASAVRLSHIPTASLNQRHGRRVAEELAELPPSRRPDGIVTAADSLAVGLVQAFTTLHGIHVPQDVAVTGYDDNHLASETPIPVTTVRQPGRQMGEVSARLLMEEIRDPGHHAHQTVTLEPRLIVRESTTAPG